jgi:hypothetical protein
MSNSQTSLEDLTIGELRRALSQGSSELTIREALAAFAEADEVNARHEQKTIRYQQYLKTREQRRLRAEEEAMEEVDREQQRSCRPWPNREERFTARRDAGLEARERFEIDEPLLLFEDWVEAGSPERYRAETSVARAEGLLRRFGSVAG